MGMLAERLRQTVRADRAVIPSAPFGGEEFMVEFNLLATRIQGLLERMAALRGYL